MDRSGGAGADAQQEADENEPDQATEEDDPASACTQDDFSLAGFRRVLDGSVLVESGANIEGLPPEFQLR